MTIELPDFAMVLLIGASGSGKSTFGQTHFLPTEVLSSDHFRALVSDDEQSLEATNDAFEALHGLAEIRLRRRNLVVVDATNVQAAARKPLLEIARKYHAVPVAIVLDVPERVCHARNAERPNRNFGRHVVERHIRELRSSVRNLRREGFRYVWHLHGVEEITNATIKREPLWTDKRSETGKFDIIGDVHGCYDELTELLTTLEYAPDAAGVWRHAEGRRLLFLGDIVDRGPKVVESARLVMDAMAAGAAFCVPGNHDDKLKRALEAKPVSQGHGLAESLAQIEALPEEEKAAFKARFIAFVDGMVSHLWLDGGNLVAAHAGMKAEMYGRASGKVREFALYGETTGETDEFGLPVRGDWASEYRGKAMVVYGHTPVYAPQWLNNTINIDTGCVFGNALTALRYPEKELVSVAAREEYVTPARPLNAPAEETNLQWVHDEVLNIADYTGKKIVSTRLGGNLTIAEENANAALEIMTRYAVHPRWLLYLPPTMSPVETSTRPDYLEHPDEAFSYFASQRVETVLCEEKHMGSRAVMVVCRTPEVAKARFGAENAEWGAVFTRTGRPFFKEKDWTESVLQQTAQACEATNLWEELQTDWLCLDVEILPWNAKAQVLLQEQYAPTAAAGRAVLGKEAELWQKVQERGIAGAEAQVAELQVRLADLEAYARSYGNYCWNVQTLDDVKIAPFHMLAGEGQTFLDKPHPWHMELLARLASVSPLFRATATLAVQTRDPESCAAGVEWWRTRTETGGEGMVVKPLDFLPGKGQPAVKVRGREYLRIIYGPEYTAPENLKRLRARAVGRKRSLAWREFALGVEALERFVRKEPLRRVHECVFGVLSLESEPIDPRL